MIFLLDNYDSFTYNLVQYLEELGAEVRVERNDMITVDEIRAMKPNGLVLSPGPGRPENSGILNELIKAMANELPILGVCLGHQALGQTFGGKIDYAPQLMHGKTSEIHHDNSKLFSSIDSPFVATRYHSLVINPETLPTCFKRTAWTDDNVIMAIEHKELPLYGVQFHPESIMTSSGKQLLANFLGMLS